MAKHMALFGSSIIIVVALSLLFAATDRGTEAMQYDVGDSFGWNSPPNQTFFSGDSLVFKWTGNHTVADVTREDYNNCTSSSPFTGSQNGTEFMVTLEHLGRRYFICTVDDHCERGQKFSINVEWPFSSPQPPFHDDNSAPTLLSYGVLSVFLSTIVVYFFACF